MRHISRLQQEQAQQPSAADVQELRSKLASAEVQAESYRPQLDRKAERVSQLVQEKEDEYQRAAKLVAKLNTDAYFQDSWKRLVLELYEAEHGNRIMTIKALRARYMVGDRPTLGLKDSKELVERFLPIVPVPEPVDNSRN